MTAPLLQVDQVTRRYNLPRESLWQAPPVVHALQGVSLTIESGRSLGVVGESGSGKSTLARLVMSIEKPNSGSVKLLGRNMGELNAAALRDARRDFQMVFQDPYGSLDPRQKIEKIVCEPLAVLQKHSPAQMRSQASEVLASVGLRDTDLDKYPHEFSGGQRQRIAIARALALEPSFIMLDEPTSALDMSVQAQIVDLLRGLQQKHNLAYLFISHDLKVVRALANEVIVMRNGKMVEQGPTADVFTSPKTAYTQALIAAALNLKSAPEGVVSQ